MTAAQLASLAGLLADDTRAAFPPALLDGRLDRQRAGRARPRRRRTPLPDVAGPWLDRPHRLGPRRPGDADRTRGSTGLFGDDPASTASA
jgi:hypothetical protein